MLVDTSTEAQVRRPRRHRLLSRFLVTLAAFAVLLSGFQMTSAPRADAASTRKLQTGAQVFSMWRDWSTNTKLLDQLAAAGSQWVRIDVGWCTLEEAGKGKVSEWYQSRLDAAVDQARSRGLKVLATLGCTPGWLSGQPSNYQVLPSNVAEYQRISRYLATRYKGRVAAWEIWNEPDCSTGVCGELPASSYVPLLKAGFAGVRSGDPAAKVVSGGISGNNDRWIRDLYKAGAKGAFDVLAVHSYQGPVSSPPDAPADGSIYRLTNVEAVRQVMRDFKDYDRKIWITEMGWSTGAGEGWYAGVSEDVQARYTEQALHQIQDRYPYVTNTFLYALRDRDDWSVYENNFGLVHLDGSPKPSWYALQRANSWLAGR